MEKYSLSEETLGYSTSPDPSNTEPRLLTTGSKNVLIDYQKKVKTRSGYTRLGAANTALTAIRNAWTWNTSTGHKRYLRFYDDELEVYLATIGSVVVNVWTRVLASWSTTERMRATTWWDTQENLDLFLAVIGDANIYEWGGSVAAVASITATTIVKQGTNTWAQDRFYSAGSKTLINTRTGTEYTYTGGETTTTLTGIADTAGILADDILIQKIVTNSNAPAAGRTNHFIHQFENQIALGSEDDEEVFISSNTSFTTFTQSSPRVAGEGATLPLDDPVRAFATLGKKLIVFAGRSSVYETKFEQIAISGSSIAETLKIQKLDTGVDQGALNQESVVQIGNAIAYLSNEVAVRIIESPDQITGINPRTLSNPIKPDFDAETWLDSNDVPDAFGVWYKNILIFTAPQTSRMYMLNFVEDADGKLFRFWNPPQTLPIGVMTIINSGRGDLLHGHSNSVPETYLLFDGASDGQYSGMPIEDKLPIDAKAAFAYDDFGDRANLKTFDEYYVEGEITPATAELELGINYDFEGSTQVIQKFINGSDEDILEGNVGFNSLAQQSLAVNPLGGLLNAPSDARKFRVTFEIAKEDFHMIQPVFSTNDVDKYWAIIAHGTNAKKSPRKNTLIHK